ncbi:FMN-dependent NADH-azoreductase [Luteimonas aquatica]|uniref:FMN-dependent NADH-azoreductase n=1 Tax=Luteimonas aquatica TaxID=450364 RepID=UPI001F5676E5|nr:NAD(P)H-dependent oxidoreductase [Luteimonas aquatica]
MNILHIDSSIQGGQSVSRALSAAAVSRLREFAPEAKVTYRDVASAPIPQFSAAIASGLVQDTQTAESRRDAEILGTVLDEVLAADVIVIGAPMYNFGIPSQLKSWLDALAVPGRTFRYGAAGVEGLLGDKRVVIASSRGGFYGPDSPAAALEHQESHLRGFLGFLGVTRVDVVRAEGTKVNPEQALQGGLRQATQLEAA